MAITVTTLSGAVVIDQNTIAVASATGFAANSTIQIDQETLKVASSYVSGTTIPVLRGLDGTATQAHVSGAQVKVGLASDFTGPAPQMVTTMPIGGPARERVSVTVAGALPFPKPGNDIDIVLNGTSVIASTLTNPTTDMDGCRMTIMGNGKAAHTVTYTTVGLGNVGATADVLTFKADQAQAVQLIACGGFWLGPAQVVGGAATVAGVGLA
jgi:hypothetical protein